MHLDVADLDGAFAGESRDRAAVERIVATFPGYLQLDDVVFSAGIADAGDHFVVASGRPTSPAGSRMCPKDLFVPA